MASNKVVSFIYRSFWEPNHSLHTVLSCQIVVNNGQVYLYAADENNHNHIRIYDIHKVYELQVLSHTFTPPASLPDGRFF